MEKTYKHTIKNLAGEEVEVDINRLTVRHGLRLQGKGEGEIVEVLLDMVAPGVLDMIAVDSLSGLSEAIMEKEKDFFAQMAIVAKKALAKKQSVPNSGIPV